MIKHFAKFLIFILLVFIILSNINHFDFLFTFLVLLMILSVIYSSFVYYKKARHFMQTKKITDDYLVFLSKKNANIKNNVAFINGVFLYNSKYKFGMNPTKMCVNYYFETKYKHKLKTQLETLKLILKDFPEFEDFTFKTRNNKLVVRYVKSKPIKITSLDYFLNKLEWPSITNKEFDLIMSVLKNV